MTGSKQIATATIVENHAIAASPLKVPPSRESRSRKFHPAWRFYAGPNVWKGANLRRSSGWRHSPPPAG